MGLFAICAGTGRGSGQLAPNFGAVWMVPPNRQPEQRSLHFVFICEKAKGGKSGLKPMRKLDCGVRYVSFYQERHCQMSVEPTPPPSLKIVPAPLA